MLLQSMKNKDVKWPKTNSNLKLTYSEEKRTDKMSVYVKMEEPDIFLVTDIGDEDSDALMLNTEIQFQYTSVPGDNRMVRF